MPLLVLEYRQGHYKKSAQRGRVGQGADSFTLSGGEIISAEIITQGEIIMQDAKLQKKRREIAAKLKPRPRELPSGMWRCEAMVKGERISVVDEDPAVAHAKVLAIKAGVIEETKNPRRITIEAAIDRYIDSKDAILSPSTIVGYKKMKRNDFAALLKVNVADITQEKIQRWVNALAKEKSSKSVRNAHGLLACVLAEYRPEMTLRTTLPQKDAKRINIPDEDQIAIIMQGCKGREEELPIMLALWLGLRASEIRGLTWDDVQDGRLHVKQAIVQGEEGPVLKKTKTVSGDRWIKLPDHIAALIEAQPRRGDHIVTLSGQAMYKRFMRLCERLGLPHFRFHDLRHTAASVSALLGVPTKYSQQRMGHQTDNMLKTVYEHTMRSKEDEFAERIDEYFEQKLRTDLRTDLRTEK